MAILDAEPHQAWIRAYDRYEAAQRRFDAASAQNIPDLVEYLRGELAAASAQYNAVIRELRGR